MNKKLEFKEISEKQNARWVAVGNILKAVRWLTVYKTFYSNFFKRQNYLNRRTLLKWLKNNKLPECDVFYHPDMFRYVVYKWKIQGHTLYYWKDNRVSLMDSVSNVVVCSFIGGVLNKKNDEKIKEILKKEIKDLK